jgi:hypothetical protein
MGMNVFTDAELVDITGPVTIRKNSKTGDAGSLTVANGATITGGVNVDILEGGSSTAIQTVADSGTIAISKRVAKVSGAAGATVAGAALGTAGVVGGQELIVVNENLTVGSTLVISTNVIVKAGTTTTTISGLAAARFIWDEVQTKWVLV